MKRVVVCSAAVALLGLLMPQPAGAQQAVDVRVTEVGWWSANPVPIAQPDGGFQITAGPDGSAQSVAALRLSIAGTQVDSMPVSFVESNSAGTDFGILRLCTTQDPWVAANPGTLDAAPTPDCTTATNMTRTLEGVWLADAAALAPNGGEVSLMVVPLYQAPSPAPIGSGMIVTISGGEVAATGSDTTTTTQPGATDPPVDAGSSFNGDSTDFFPPSVGSSFGVPDTVVDPDFGSVPAPATEVRPTDDFALPPVKGDSGPAAPWIRLLVLVPLSVGVGLGATRSRRLFAA